MSQEEKWWQDCGLCGKCVQSWFRWYFCRFLPLQRINILLVHISRVQCFFTWRQYLQIMIHIGRDFISEYNLGICVIWTSVEWRIISVNSWPLEMRKEVERCSSVFYAPSYKKWSIWVLFDLTLGLRSVNCKTKALQESQENGITK